jgi:hypothetical protein
VARTALLTSADGALVPAADSSGDARCRTDFGGAELNGDEVDVGTTEVATDP